MKEAADLKSGSSSDITSKKQKYLRTNTIGTGGGEISGTTTHYTADRMDKSVLKDEDEAAGGTLDDMNIHNSMVTPQEEEKKEVSMEFRNQNQRNIANNNSSIYDIDV